MNDFTGKAKGGMARAAALTPERRKEISKNASLAKKKLASLPRSDYRGEIKIGGMALACCVLHDGTRLVSEHGLTSTLGSAGGKTYRLRNANSEEVAGPMPLFLASKALQPFIGAVFEEPDLSAVEYVENGKIQRGYSAAILPKVCEVWLAAKDAGALQPSQLGKAKKAEILIRGLAHVGIIALIDEATGYQRDRARDSLARILEEFVAKELQPYVKKFPAEFYEEMFRLRGLQFDPKSVKRPRYFGHLTNDIVYRRLAPGVWKELKAQTKKNDEGRLSHHLHRLLTPDVGDPRLKDMITRVVTVMQLSDEWSEFKAKLDKVAPAFDSTLQLPIELENDSGKGL